jgi:trehalose 6-phosphate synthase
MSRLLIVSNRLPVTVEKRETGYHRQVSSGGLVTALRPIVQRHRGCWIGWTGSDHDFELENAIRSTSEADGFRMVPVFLSERDRHDFYCGFCNEILWPLFHDLQSRCNFEPTYWDRYLEVNSRFSEVVRSAAQPDDVVWVHDYHLILQGKLLSKYLDRERLFYFHHIPFPPADVFEKLPWRSEVLQSLLAFHVVGFQCTRDQRNFLPCLRRFVPLAQIRKAGANLVVRHSEGETVVGAFPIGIDFDDFAQTAIRKDVAFRAQEIRAHLKAAHIVLGVDRLDYTKGIPERLKAFRALLSKYPGLHGAISFVQVIVPSREDIPHYQELKRQVELLVSDINGAFGGPGWMPVHYLHRHLSREELVAYYRAADIAMITPLKDGMNLVAKEFCASRVQNDGVLILSEFAGAATQLRTGALLVNPYDREHTASTLYNALDMSEGDIRRRMRRMRRVVQETSVYQWCDQFLAVNNLLGLLSHSSDLGRQSGCMGALKVELPLSTRAAVARVL